MRRHAYYVYILTNVPRIVMYVGVTNDLERRLGEHQSGLGGAFTKRYQVHTLVYVEEFQWIDDAIACESESRAGAAPRKTLS